MGNLSFRTHPDSVGWELAMTAFDLAMTVVACHCDFTWWIFITGATML